MRTYIIILLTVWCCSPATPYEAAEASPGDGGPDGGSDTDTGENGDGGADSDSDTDADADADGDTDSDSDTEFPNDSGPDSSGDADTDADTDTDADSDSDEPVPCFASEGLCWALEPASELLTHEGALEYCGALGAGWRLPTVNELRWGLAAGVPDDGCEVFDSSCLAEWCAEDCTGGPAWEGPAEGCYWPLELGSECGGAVERSSSPRTDVVGYHWGVNFITGSVVDLGDAAPDRVRCVRAD